MDVFFLKIKCQLGQMIPGAECPLKLVKEILVAKKVYTTPDVDITSRFGARFKPRPFTFLTPP